MTYQDYAEELFGKEEGPKILEVVLKNPMSYSHDYVTGSLKQIADLRAISNSRKIFKENSELHKFKHELIAEKKKKELYRLLGL